MKFVLTTRVVLPEIELDLNFFIVGTEVVSVDFELSPVLNTFFKLSNFRLIHGFVLVLSYRLPNNKEDQATV